jgi:YggT family protein
MSDVLCPLLWLFIVILFARIIVSWFPAPSGSITAMLSDGLRFLTDWILVPLRNVIPPVGMFDISATILIFFLLVLQRAICG